MIIESIAVKWNENKKKITTTNREIEIVIDMQTRNSIESRPIRAIPKFYLNSVLVWMKSHSSQIEQTKKSMYKRTKRMRKGIRSASAIKYRIDDIKIISIHMARIDQA